ncbi:ribosomal protein L7/L12 [Streptomyces sp. CA-251387]|uniref:ribosomal protein L7/L12 n=1 Tax=Streptomyces sp. CA-251387 TaxID=3240064 RepID=UPI003D89F6CB
MDIAAFVFAFVGLMAVLTIQSRVSQADQRVARVERKLDLIIDHLGLRADDPRMNEVVALVRDGKKIQAIKVYREITGAGLKEAKDAVEGIA